MAAASTAPSSRIIPIHYSSQPICNAFNSGECTLSRVNSLTTIRASSSKALLCPFLIRRDAYRRLLPPKSELLGRCQPGAGNACHKDPAVSKRRQGKEKSCGGQENVGGEHETCEEPSSTTRRALVAGTLAASLTTTTTIQRRFMDNQMAKALVVTEKEKAESKLVMGNVNELRSRVSSFTLPNGLRWIVLERHSAPVVACHTYANVGASKERDGYTGIAHLLEHLAFKGTRIVGTRNADKEALLLDELDELFYCLLEAQMEGKRERAEQLNKKFLDLQAMASSLSVPNEYGALIARQGGIGLNAETTQDATEYYVSLPANKLELWMALESGRFIAPVFRELYSEKKVVEEERRLRVDNTPYGSFIEAFTQTAFPHHPYGCPVIGYPGDFEKIGRREVTEFYKEYYIPNNLTCAVVGDVDPMEVERLARYYFGNWNPCSGSRCLENVNPILWHKDGSWNSVVRTDGPHSLTMDVAAQPFYMEGYYRPSSLSSDDPTISVIRELLSGGRLSRFYKNVILAGKALSATSVDAFPGDQHPCLFLLYGAPSVGMETESLALVFHNELEGLASEVLDDDLRRVKKSARASLLELFGSNEGIAKLLCKYDATTGTYNNLFEEIEHIEAVTPVDVTNVSSILFSSNNCIKGSVKNLNAL